MDLSIISDTKVEESSLKATLGFDDMSEEERGNFLEAVGVLVIESAVTKFMVSLLPAERMAFETWLEAKAESDNLFEAALEAYPLFAEILTEETNAFASETSQLLGLAE